MHSMASENNTKNGSLYAYSYFLGGDDFFQTFESEFHQFLLEPELKKRIICGQLTLSEVMTIVISFHSFGYCCFKHFYLQSI